MLSISVSGTHSVGKTTLIESISDDLKDQDFFVAKEIARKMISEGFLMSKDITEYGIINYALRYLKLGRECESKIFVSDRSLIDLLSYITVNESLKVRQPYIELIKEIVVLESIRFDFYIYIPPEIPFVFDNVRPVDEKYRLDVAQVMEGYLSEFNLNYYELTGTVKERKRQMLEIIEVESNKKLME